MLERHTTGQNQPEPAWHSLAAADLCAHLQAIGNSGLDEAEVDSGRKRMSVIFERDGRLACAVKGAPTAVLPRCDRKLTKGRSAWQTMTSCSADRIWAHSPKRL
ncbi:MAG: hypothetical protein LAP85_14360 [Acidobacteriia bacterium]|nr:hypothetical protein [Terriglobia bacterium]